ncbi:DEAD/DEAH box helicase [Treponema parvum]|uniref:DEAD/DEAH box helicase n=1 Tax=Treponema parvum TaxID=138851 RepID=A0A975IC34_9SPIR|nr:DEAD/DEAH box helicase [Treponema parvum]QTQ11398.1 DEAD/DEAH box helicase [Treponema parvum]
MNEGSGFLQLGINKSIIEKLKLLSIYEPTAVQTQVIPAVMEGCHVTFRSETGTGKTFSYLLPLIQKLEDEAKGGQKEIDDPAADSKQNSKRQSTAYSTGIEPSARIRMIVAAPTYELASQIRGAVQSVSGLKTALFIGGAPIRRQIETLKERPVIAVGNPARLLELIRLKKLKPDGIRAIVFDEADRLTSKELREESTGLLSLMPKNVQFIACSATITEATKKILMGSSENNGENDKKVKTFFLPAEDILRGRITHLAIFAESRDKIDVLRRFLNTQSTRAARDAQTAKAKKTGQTDRASQTDQLSPPPQATQPPEKILIFTSRADQVENIVAKLNFKKIDCMGLYSKADKKSRRAAIDRFRNGKCKILVTSDLAARGLDISGITHVVQMDMPSNDDFFIHRAGRTARAGKTGINVVIGDEYEMDLFSRLEKRLKITVYPKELREGKLVSP